ncbi:hypothetical protein [Nocardia jinanensis]|uniref:Uncharacterized protein n=1 Tax=Nocardia jinanensis TaxID=382504 RepID=A0A917RY87_9NOCA|nr:hypothetical protein [Nocardia jinanensis]GGL44295.1 hypothetical protein GCM10011588_68780 [Nocardia jinanensis]
MSVAGFDDLEFARQQLRLAIDEFADSEMTPQVRVRLGLLASQVALADLLSGLLPGAASDNSDTVEPELAADDPDEVVRWTPALCERILRTSAAAGHRLVQALVAEGGSASVARLTELTGDPLLRAATQTLNMAARREGVGHALPDRRLIQAYRYPNPVTSKVTAYSLPADSLPSFTTAVERLGELHRRLHE